MLFAVLLSMVSNASLLSAETYRWTDADGSIHFSDTPPVKANGRQPAVQRDDVGAAPVKPSQRSSATAPAGSRQSSDRQSWKPDAACMEELRAFDKKLSKDEKVKSCTASIQANIRQRYSAECLRQLDAKKFDFSPACQQEFQAVGQATVAELQQCMNMGNLIESSISARCREQSERYQKQVALCGEKIQKIARACGQNAKCFEEHQAELADCR